MLMSQEQSVVAWDEQGRRVAWALDDCTAAVVVGSDPTVSANVALGIARVHARRRRVAVIDLVGDLAPLARLTPPDAQHGLMDHVMYGVSLAHVAYAVDRARNLFVVPGGMGVALDELLDEEAWHKMVAAFREAQALALMVAPAGASRLPELLAATNGAVVVGHDVSVAADRVITIVDAPRPRPEPVLTPAREKPAAVARRPLSVRQLMPLRPGEAFPAVEQRVRHEWQEIFRRPDRKRGLLWTGAAAAVFAAVVLVVATTRSDTIPDPPSGSVSAQAAGSTVPSSELAAADRMVPAAPSPIDSARAHDYSLSLTSFTSQTSANARLAREEDRGVRAATYSPIILGGSARWYRVTIGAYTDSAGADSALRALRTSGVLDASEGSVQRTPFALLLQSGVSPENAPALVRAWRLKGYPVYALLQDNGTARLYAGAFDTPEQAGWLLSMFLSGGERPSVSYRIGRPF
ncbi:MAG: SPOR domain-containing protein [Gemmatimonadaceae bacterium]